MTAYNGETSFGTVRAFIDAIVAGDHHGLWELLGPIAREHVLARAQRRGMDPAAAARAREGTWASDEADALLSALVRGLRVDLSGVDINEIMVIDEPELQRDGSVRFRLESTCLLPPEITGGAHWAAGAVIVTEVDGAWRIARLVPQPPAGPTGAATADSGRTD